jgi:hypothetical protein
MEVVDDNFDHEISLKLINISIIKIILKTIITITTKSFIPKQVRID